MISIRLLARWATIEAPSDLRCGATSTNAIPPKNACTIRAGSMWGAASSGAAGSSPAARGDTEKLGGAPLDGRKSRHHSERDGEIDEPELLLQLKQRANDGRAGQQIIHHVHNETGRDVAVEARHKRQANAGEEGEHDRWWRNMGRPENR